MNSFFISHAKLFKIQTENTKLRKETAPDIRYIQLSHHFIYRREIKSIKAEARKTQSL